MKKLCAKYTDIVTKHHNRFTEPGMRNNLEIARGHILYMLKKIPNLDTHGKQNRWIGFVQGWLWSNGIRNIDEMREDIREVLDRDEMVDMPLPVPKPHMTIDQMRDYLRKVDLYGVPQTFTKEESRDLMALMPTSNPLELTEEDKRELAEKMREHQHKRDQDWSTLASQVVGAENP